MFTYSPPPCRATYRAAARLAAGKRARKPQNIPLRIAQWALIASPVVLFIAAGVFGLPL